MADLSQRVGIPTMDPQGTKRPLSKVSPLGFLSLDAFVSSFRRSADSLPRPVGSRPLVASGAP
jgi:hypothetical protein